MVQPRTAHPIQAIKYNVVPVMGLQCVNYSGMDSMTVKSEGTFTKISPMLCFHETISIAGHPENNCLLENKLE